EKLAMFTQRIKDYFSAFRMIQNYSVEKQVQKRFEMMNQETETAKDDADYALAFVNRLGSMCIPMTKFVMMGFGIILVMLGKMTMGSIFTAFQLSNQFVGPLTTVMARINSMEAVQGVAARIKNMATNSKKEQKQSDIKLDSSATLKLEDIRLNMGGRQIIDGVSYTFEPGKKYLIIGRNGAGKSTLLKLLKRSWEDYTGTITINGNDLKDFSYASLSGVVSYINEAVPLLCDTVRQNILLYRNVPEERLQEVVKLVGLKVPLDRVIRDGDRNLSSGEIRRIEIARSLINSTNVIVYDEAISTLDIPTAFEIEKTLLELKDQTVLFVSHNFSAQLIGAYDRILLLDQGKICGEGTHRELMANSEYYRQIMQIKNG
ncbi:MAG: ABC transporter ATP-binding protein, partial [Oscillospiraceae bacterium]|nr:ABC transporter ATP-binding protein [Oscillospiraceae bacterium]